MSACRSKARRRRPGGSSRAARERAGQRRPCSPCGRRRRSTWKMPSSRAAISPGARAPAPRRRPVVESRRLGCAGAAVDDQELEVGGVAHLAAAELPERQHRQRGTAPLRRAGGRASRPAERGPSSASATTASARSAAPPRSAPGRSAGSSRCCMSIEQHLLVLERVQHAACASGRGARERARAASARSSARPRSGRVAPARPAPAAACSNCGPQEVLPQERGSSPAAAPARAGPPGVENARARSGPLGEQRGRGAGRSRAAPARGRARQGSKCVNCLISATATPQRVAARLASIVAAVARARPGSGRAPRPPTLSMRDLGGRRRRAARARWRARRGSRACPGRARPSPSSARAPALSKRISSGASAHGGGARQAREATPPAAGRGARAPRRRGPAATSLSSSQQVALESRRARGRARRAVAGPHPEHVHDLAAEGGAPAGRPPRQPPAAPAAGRGAPHRRREGVRRGRTRCRGRARPAGRRGSRTRRRSRARRPRRRAVRPRPLGPSPALGGPLRAPSRGRGAARSRELEWRAA